MTTLLKRLRGSEIPDGRVAIVEPDAGVVTTYGELRDSAEQYAALFVAYGIQPGDLVGVLLRPGRDMYAALLGLWIAGCAYLVLDPAGAPERLRKQLELARCRSIVSSSDIAIRRSELGDVAIVDLNRQAAPAASTNHRPAPIAYGCFTSGSTGTPKLVSVPMAAIDNFVVGQRYFAAHGSDRVLQASTPEFDAFNFEVWATLYGGGAVVVAPPHLLLRGPARLADWCFQNKITAAFLTTTVFNQLVAADLADLGVIRTILFGGELANSTLVKQAVERYPHLSFVNAYGPTETTTFASALVVETENCNADGSLAVGRPLESVTIYVDEGEVVIGGAGLALGYINDPRQTAAVFRPDANAAREGARAYHTGDYGRLDDGVLTVEGRRDRQVKVRGYRIELNEIDVMISSIEGVTSVMSTVVSLSSSKRIVSLYSGSVDEAVVRAHLRTYLPGYMMPNLIARIDDLPMRATGKLDAAGIQQVALSLFD